MHSLRFAGSAGRPKLGMAEVELTLDNSSRVLPLDLNEVTISRSTDRAGTSEYKINGAEIVLELAFPGSAEDDARYVRLSEQPSERHLRNVRQLTFGGNNAEAYFSPDGRRLIFQRQEDTEGGFQHGLKVANGPRTSPSGRLEFLL